MFNMVAKASCALGRCHLALFFLLFPCELKPFKIGMNADIMGNYITHINQ